MKKNNKRKGFTLVELLVVIAILAILASVTVVGYMGFTKKAKDSVAMQEAEQIETTIYGTLMDGTTVSAESTTYTYEFSFANDVLTIKVTGNPALSLANPTAITSEVLTTVIKAAFELDLTGTFAATGSSPYVLEYTKDGSTAQVGNFTVALNDASEDVE